jgi:MFS family permease
MKQGSHGGGREGEALRPLGVGTHEEEVGPNGEPLEAEALEAEEGPSRLTTNRPDPAGLDPSGTGAPEREPLRTFRDTSRETSRAALSGLLHTPGFIRLWLAQIISNVGDWAYVLAVATAVAAKNDPNDLARVMAVILGLEAISSAVVGTLVAGPIADRFPRRRVMIASDVTQGLAVASLLVVPNLWLPHLAVVAIVLGAGRAVFQPALMSSLPGLVTGDRLVTANAVVTSTFHVAIMVGPAIGAVLVATMGASGAFALNAASFGASAVLLVGLALPVANPEERQPWRPVADLVEGARFVARSPVVRSVAIVMGLVLLLVAAHKPLELGLVRGTLAPTDGDGVRAALLGLFTAAWGGGMVAGSALAPAAARRWSRERLLSVSVAAAGLAYLGAALIPTVPIVTAMWLIGGTAAGIANVSYETLLQERTPDAFLGRAFAAVEAVQEGGYFVGALIVAAIGGLVSPTIGMAVVGVAFLSIAALSLSLFRRAQDRTSVLPEEEPVIVVPEAVLVSAAEPA